MPESITKVRPDEMIASTVYDHTPAGTVEIAEAIGVSRQGAAYRLKRLEKAGLIKSKKIGPTRVWIHPAAIDKSRTDFMTARTP